jgi:RND family efflux transporter, MFP subunit
MKASQIFAIAAILAVTVVAGRYILISGGGMSAREAYDNRAQEEHESMTARQEHDESKDDNEKKGPHGGRMFTQDDYGLEVTIFEQGVEPEFRVYAFEQDKPVNPAEVELQIQLERLGEQTEIITFRKEKDFLRSDREIIEPHSFTVTVMAKHRGKVYRWFYEQEEGRVRMDDATVETVGIEVKTAGPMNIRTTLQLSGEIQFNQDFLVHVVPRLAGVAVKSAVNLGDEVKKGDLLAILESQQLADLKSEHLATQNRLDLARITFKREKQLWEEKISAEQDYLISRQALNEAEISHRTVEQKLIALGLTHDELMSGGSDGLTRYEIRAPIDGLIIEKHLGLGEAVQEDTNIFTIADLSTVWAEMTVYPKDLNKVKVGQHVTVRATALNAEADGQVSYVGSLVGEETRSAKGRVTLQNPDRSWRPGLFVTADLVQDETEVPVAVPVDAVQTYRDLKVVFGRFGEFFEVRPVELGRSDGQWVEVIQGLAPNTRYAAANSFVLKADLGKAGASHDH